MVPVIQPICITDGTFQCDAIMQIHFICLHVILTSLCRSLVCSEILNCRGDNVQHAMRVRITCYPEDLCAVWVMLAVKYTSIVH